MSPRNLLVVRLGAMGDIIHALPALTALRYALPETKIGWIVEERWAELLCTLPTPRSGPRSAQRPLVDRIHSVDTVKWRKAALSLQTWLELATALSDLRAGDYDVAIDFQGAARSALLARWSGAAVIYGMRQPRENIAGMFYTRVVTTRGNHIVEQNLSLAQAVVENRLRTPAIEFPLDENADQECQRRLLEKRISNFAILNPGAGWGAKRWPAERYGEVAKALAKEGIKVLINFGPGETELMHAVEVASGGAAEGISCSISQLIALTKHASLFIGGDTGPMHLAAALQIPVVAIFGPTNPARNGPFGTRSIVLRSPSSITSHARRAQPEEGLLEITPQQVITAARQLLGAVHV